MPADDALLFIDANKYLDLYRTDKGKKLLALLDEQADYIFITRQVVNEVQRNKILVAEGFLKQKFRDLKLPFFNVPDHLSGTNTGQGAEILKQMREIGQKVKKINDEVDKLALGILEQISLSQDEVSEALSPIFAKAVTHSTKQLKRARDRRELGNPPGKSNNPIGDQLTWEQILTHFQGKKRLWIISRDGDYGTVYGGRGFMNHFLRSELCEVTVEPEVYLFEKLVEGITHFVNTTGVKAEKRLTPEEVNEIEREEKSLSSYQPESASKALIDGLNPNGSYLSSIAKVFENVERLNLDGSYLGSIAKVLENVERLNLDGTRLSNITKGLGIIDKFKLSNEYLNSISTVFEDAHHPDLANSQLSQESSKEAKRPITPITPSVPLQPEDEEE
ncbi:MAG: hypothetical protein DCF15_05250 [Phormidesmis priestleyi]|uniref:DUF4935 domain-containing protein n=1 Tax=Phormidesmis priestleyi TaxID=268141 RepID=A0A2W4ZK78_9CYAN|nr:MAG: hypothetical protein DCF15_05250 [Phormidesmis priestleyi]